MKQLESPQSGQLAGANASAVKSRAVFKQYGERRTGTNYLRFLMEQNFSDALVLMHVLGDKHSPPAAVQLPDDPSPAESFEWVRAMTFERPALTTREGDPEQEAHLRSIASEIRAAFRSQRFGYLISIKNPYAWGVSVAAFECYLPPESPRNSRKFRSFPRVTEPLLGKAYESRACLRLRRDCLRLNECYRAWLDLHQRSDGRSTIVRYEDLLKNPDSVLERIGRQYDLHPRGGAVLSSKKITRPADWDHLPAPAAKATFDPEYYLQARYMNLMTPWMRATISLSIDWQLMSKFGYERQ